MTRTRVVGEWLPQDLARLREAERHALDRLKALRERDAAAVRDAVESEREVARVEALLAEHGDVIRAYDAAKARVRQAEGLLRVCRSRNGPHGETDLARERRTALTAARTAVPRLPFALRDEAAAARDEHIEQHLHGVARRARERGARVAPESLRTAEHEAHDATARHKAAEALAASPERLRSFAAALSPREAALLRSLADGSRPKARKDDAAHLCALGLIQAEGGSMRPTPLGEAVAPFALATGRAAPLATPAGERRKAFGADTRASLVAATRAALAQLAEEDAPEGVVGTVEFHVSDELGEAAYTLAAEPAALRRLLRALGEQTDEAPPASPASDPPPFVPGRFL